MLNRYAIDGKPVGIGTFGEVSKAVQVSTGEVVAVKRMRQRFASWEECLQLREIISLRRLQHPCIIKLKEVVRENTELFLIFEYMDQNVYQIMRSRSEALGVLPSGQHNGPTNIFTEKEIRSVMAQTLLGLQAIHRGGFMHRDLKPENLLTKGDTVKIADFGLAKEIRSRPPFTDYVSTRWYRAPEICLRSTNYNSPIDVWACGVIFAELYLNRALFPGSSDSDQLFKMCSVLGPPTVQEWDEGHQLARRLNIRFPSISPTPLKTLLSNAGPQALDLIESMLRYNPADRPTSPQCLQHPFFTGAATASDGLLGGGLSVVGHTSATLFQGIASGMPHNPFHMAAGMPPSAASGSGMGIPPTSGVSSAGTSSAGSLPNTALYSGQPQSPWIPQGSSGLQSASVPGPALGGYPRPGQAAYPSQASLPSASGQGSYGAPSQPQSSAAFQPQDSYGRYSPNVGSGAPLPPPGHAHAYGHGMAPHQASSATGVPAATGGPYNPGYPPRTNAPAPGGWPHATDPSYAPLQPSGVGVSSGPYHSGQSSGLISATPTHLPPAAMHGTGGAYHSTAGPPSQSFNPPSNQNRHAGGRAPAGLWTTEEDLLQY